MTDRSNEKSVRSKMKVRFKERIVQAYSFDIGCLIFALITTILVVFSAVMRIGTYVFNLPAASVFEWISVPIAVGLVIGMLLAFVVLYGIAGWCYAWFSKTTSRAADIYDEKKRPSTFRSVCKQKYMKYFFILVLCWLPWLIGHLPGAIDEDTIWQTLIWRTPDMWNDHHPWVTTMLFGSVLDLGSLLGSQSYGLVLYSIVQVLIMAVLFAGTLCYLKRFNIPKGLFCGCFVLLCALPLYPSFASEMAKDPLFCVFFLPFMVGFVEGVRTKGSVLEKPLYLVLMVGITTAAFLTRKTGAYIIIPTLILMVIYVGRAWKIRWTAVLIVPAVIMLCWNAILLPSMNVEKGPSKELFSCPLQQSAFVVVKDGATLTSEQQEAINAVLPYQAIPRIYNLCSADPIKDSFKNPATPELLVYLKTWLVVGIQHPFEYATATMGTNMQLFNPGSPYRLKEEVTPEWLEENVQFFGAFLTTGQASEVIAERNSRTNEGITALLQLSGVRALTHAYEKLVNYTPLRLVNTPFFMVFFLPFLMIAYALSKYSKGHRTALLLSLVPSFLLFASIIVGPLMLDRYCIPSADIALLIAGLPWVLSMRSQPEKRDL